MNARQTILVMLATVVIFATGVVTGGMLVKKTTMAQQPPAQFPFLHRFEMTRRAVNAMPELGPEQRAKIQRIIDEKQELIADYFQILEPDVQQVFRQMREGIRAEMTPDQHRRFEELSRRRFLPPGERRMPEGFRPGMNQRPFSSEDPMPRPPRRPGPGPAPAAEDGTGDAIRPR